MSAGRNGVVPRRPLVFGGVLALLVALCLLPAVAGTVSASAANTVSSTDRSASSLIDTPAGVDSDTPTQPAEPCEGGPVEADPVQTPQLVKFYPNPPTEGNAGEYFVIEYPPGGDRPANLTITDGHWTATIPTETTVTADRIAYSIDPEATAPLTSYPVAELGDHFRLAADGDDLELRIDGETVETVSYGRAREGERWYRGEREVGAQNGTGSGSSSANGTWWPAGATCKPVTTATPTTAEAFVLPDNPDTPLETLAAADDRIRLAGYTYTSEPVTDELIRAAERGVEVEVLLEAGPVGGTPLETKAVLDDLEAAGVEVRLLGGSGARYAFHHPKYAIADEQVLVMTENWKPAGVGGTSSRGWGVVLEDSAMSEDLEAVFEADFHGLDTVSWTHHRQETDFVEDDAGSTRTFETTIESEPVAVEEAELLLAPDNAGDRLGEVVADAEASILLKQVRIDEDVSLLEETLEAARRGVSVRIALDASWYVEDDNRALTESLERTAEDEGLDLEVRLLEGGDSFEKIHAKGVIVDEEIAVVGSVNWNPNSVTNNREVAFVLHGEEAAGYYVDVFEDDWRSGEQSAAPSWTLPVGLLAILFVALLLLGAASYRRLRFE